MCVYRSDTNHNANQHFNQSGHSIFFYDSSHFRKKNVSHVHRSNNPHLATTLRRQKQDYWIRKLGTATLYGCNDKIDGIVTLSSPSCSSVNVINIFNSTPQRKRSHGHRHYTSPTLYNVVSMTFRIFEKNIPQE